jgi:hypothetical protein
MGVVGRPKRRRSPFDKLRVSGRQIPLVVSLPAGRQACRTTPLDRLGMAEELLVGHGKAYAILSLSKHLGPQTAAFSRQ